MTDFDVVIIGGGPGGYVGAIKAAQLGLKVACVEKRGSLGGTCLNVGCIPSKNMLHVSEQYHQAKHEFSKLGLSARGVDFDLKQVIKNNFDNIDGLCKGIEHLFKKNKVEYIKGTARIIGKGEVEVDGGTINCKNIVIATGSEVMPLKGVEPDHKHILTSDSIFKMDKLPKTMAVIGGGYIGLEMGSVWQRFGTKITVIEYLDKVVPGMDNDVGKELHKILAKEGMEFKLKTKVLNAEVKGSKVTLEIEDVDSGDTEELKFDKVLLSIGRRPYTAGLGLEGIGVELDDRGRVKTNGGFATSVDGIYAIGDVTDGPMLAHKAEEEGVALAEILAGQHGHINYNTIPAVVYTSPEVASVGKTEQELEAAGIAYNKGLFSMMANSRARTIGKPAGFVKILACKATDRILGVHIIAESAGTMIAEAVVVMEYGGSSEDLARTCHAHPTLNEAVKEAALATFAKAIHF
ncbi:MAG: dihydrolipoyl dehydrogenase [Pseudomonadota bacterium]